MSLSEWMEIAGVFLLGVALLVKSASSERQTRRRGEEEDARRLRIAHGRLGRLG